MCWIHLAEEQGFKHAHVRFNWNQSVLELLPVFPALLLACIQHYCVFSVFLYQQDLIFARPDLSLSIMYLSYCRMLLSLSPYTARLLNLLSTGKRWFRLLYVHWLSKYIMVFYYYLCFLMNVEQVIDSLQHYSFDFAVTDDMVYQFITTPPVSSYFSYLIHNLKE
jgi:hypothetical protein